MIFSKDIEAEYAPGLASDCTVRVDLDALGHNYKELSEYMRRFNPRTHLAAVAKADAYGHGADVCIPYLYSIGCRHFCVANVAEAINARLLTGDDTEILILGYTNPDAAPLIAKYGVTQTVYSPEFAQALAEKSREAGVCVKVHIKLDTGMHRLGFDATVPCDCADEICRTLELYGDAIKVEGLFTHMAEALERKVIDRQIERYEAVRLLLKERGISPQILHTSASDAFMTATCNGYDMLRMGVSLYGYGKTNYLEGTPRVKPLMTFESRIVQLHPVGDGERVGYGGEYVAKGERLIATISGGYYDGVMRSYTGAEVRVVTANGIKTANICGRICMDMFMVDVTDTGAQVGDRIIIFGEDDGTSLRKLAKHAETLEYECLCAASHARGRKIVIQNGVERTL